MNNDSVIKENINYFISVVQKDKIIKVVGKENNETKSNNLAKKIRPKYDIDKYDIIIQPSDIEKENDYKEWFNENVKLNEEKKSQNPFKCKNGRIFQTKLINAANGDSNICTMFMDNIDKSRIKKTINRIEKGAYIEALLGAFSWKDSPEGMKFWFEICGGI